MFNHPYNGLLPPPFNIDLPFSVISANANAADRCKSTLSENARVERARSGSPSKKLVSLRSVKGQSLLTLIRKGVVSTHFQESVAVLQWHLARYLAIVVHKDLSDFVLHGGRSIGWVV